MPESFLGADFASESLEVSALMCIYTEVLFLLEGDVSSMHLLSLIPCIHNKSEQNHCFLLVERNN